MASSSHCFFLVSMALVSPLLVGSALALRLTSTTYIDKLCSESSWGNDKAFCLKTLSAYPPATSAKALLPLATAVIIGIVQPQAEKAATFAAAQKDPTFKECHDAYVHIQDQLGIAADELVVDAQTANYEVFLCYDDIKKVKDDLSGKKQDPASKTLMEMTMQMADRLLPLAGAATDVVEHMK